MRKLFISADSAATALVPGALQAQAPSDSGKYGFGSHMMWGDHWYGMVLGPLFMILALAAAIAIAALLVRWLGAAWQGPASPPPGWTPLDILKERFARGEISKDEYEERRRVLGE